MFEVFYLSHLRCKRWGERGGGRCYEGFTVSNLHYMSRMTEASVHLKFLRDVRMEPLPILFTLTAESQA